MKIKITADSTCDLSIEHLQKYDISLARLTVIKDGQEFEDGKTIFPADIFAHVAAGGELCSTSAYSIGQYQILFQHFAGEYDAVIHINLGSGFSSSYQNACVAAAEFDNVYVVDSQNLSTGQGLVVLEAAKLREQGLDAQQILQKLQHFIPRVEASFVLSQLSYMVKGGRCSSAAALGANLLNLKPCIEVKEGNMSVVKKYRGTFTKCLSSYIADRLEGREDLDPSTLFFTHTSVDDDVLAAAKEATVKYGCFENIYDTVAGCTISCHCGPGTLGLLFVRE